MAARKPRQKAATVDEAEAKPLSFEESLGRLSRIVEELEEGDLTLEQSLARFEEGIGLARQTQQRLDEAEAKVERLLQVDEDGEAITEEVDGP